MIDEKVRQGKCDWIMTYTGRHFNAMQPHIDDICIEDIAHALSLMTRFNGHCNAFYSIAQHSVLLSHQFPTQYLQMWALLHDTDEAYVSDVPSPTKKYIPGYRDIEDNVMACIASKFGLNLPMPDEVHRMDKRIVHDEAIELFKHLGDNNWANPDLAIGISITPWSPEEAEDAFLSRYANLTGDYSFVIDFKEAAD